MNITSAEIVYKRLRDLNIEFQCVTHKPVFTVADIDFEIRGSQVKNLLLKSSKKQSARFYLLILPEHVKVDLKKIAALLGEKRLSFASENQLHDIFGLQLGAVGPLALPENTNGRLQVLIHDSINRFDAIGFHPNKNDETLVLAFSDLVKLLDSIGYNPIYFS